MDDFAITDMSGEPSIDGDCTSNQQLRWEDLPALPLRGLGDDDVQGVVSLTSEDIVSDSARPQDRASNKQTIVESDDDGGNNIHLSSGEDLHEPTSTNQFDKGFNDSHCVLGSPDSSRSSSPVFSPGSSQEDFPEVYSVNHTFFYSGLIVL